MHPNAACLALETSFSDRLWLWLKYVGYDLPWDLVDAPSQTCRLTQKFNENQEQLCSTPMFSFHDTFFHEQHTNPNHDQVILGKLPSKQCFWVPLCFFGRYVVESKTIGD
jgi:hypothetical protein